MGRTGSFDIFVVSLDHLVVKVNRGARSGLRITIPD
jgi:hypothetical protein